jgi:hypothetical protein
MLETVGPSVGLVPQSWGVSFPDRIARGLFGSWNWLGIRHAMQDAADLLQA